MNRRKGGGGERRSGPRGRWREWREREQRHKGERGTGAWKERANGGEESSKGSSRGRRDPSFTGDANHGDNADPLFLSLALLSAERGRERLRTDGKLIPKSTENKCSSTQASPESHSMSTRRAPCSGRRGTGWWPSALCPGPGLRAVASSHRPWVSPDGDTVGKAWSPPGPGSLGCVLAASPEPR